MDEAAARLRIVKAGKNVKLLDLNKELSEIAKKQEQALLDEKFEEAAKLRNQALETRLPKSKKPSAKKTKRKSTPELFQQKTLQRSFPSGRECPLRS